LGIFVQSWDFWSKISGFLEVESGITNPWLFCTR